MTRCVDISRTSRAQFVDVLWRAATFVLNSKQTARSHRRSMLAIAALVRINGHRDRGMHREKESMEG
jgi:hypothetical protein